ncbi:MAG TPA: hypothetical protein VEI03_15135 [Stellaceae bacterium]|nr:hypothetical protein [Stellaceae bacterium]
MSVSGISTPAFSPQHRPALQFPARRLGHQAQTQANGLPKSALSPSNSAKTGKMMAGAASKRILNLHF